MFQVKLLYGYEEGQMTIDDFSWTDHLNIRLFRVKNQYIFACIALK